MIQRAFTLLAVACLVFNSCQKDQETAFAHTIKEMLLQKDTVAFLIGLNEQLPEHKQPVCVGFGVSTVQTFPNALMLVCSAGLNNQTIQIHIETIRDNGKCPDYWLMSSSSFPRHNILKGECAAYGNGTLYNLLRGVYDVEFIFMGQTLSRGSLSLTDNQASFELNGNLVRVLDEKVNIVPDSCIFGNYFPSGQFSPESFRNFLTDMKMEGCKEVVLAPGIYRRFSAGQDGRIAGERTFIFKTRNNFEEIAAFMHEYLKTHPEIHGFIFEDSYGGYYNVKRKGY
jgi:hypothetical protein